jgi:hypothetical protein
MQKSDPGARAPGSDRISLECAVPEGQSFKIRDFAPIQANPSAADQIVSTLIRPVPTSVKTRDFTLVTSANFQAWTFKIMSHLQFLLSAERMYDTNSHKNCQLHLLRTILKRFQHVRGLD